MRVHKNWVELLQAPVRFEKDPKTEAGKRTVNIPPHVIPILVEHQRLYAGPEFFNVGLDGRRARGDTVYQAFVRARDEVGIDMTFHDLRHTGQTMAAAAGANLADLMRRLGHSSSVAALRYLHAVEGRDKEIAQNLSRMAQTHSLTHLYPPPSTQAAQWPVDLGDATAGPGQLELPLVWPDPVVVPRPGRAELRPSGSPARDDGARREAAGRAPSREGAGRPWSDRPRLGVRVAPVGDDQPRLPRADLRTRSARVLGT